MTSAKLRHLPNFITSLRIVGTAALLFLEPFSGAFFIVYTLAGFSDALDGWVARRMKLVSELGTQLDSAADLLFYTVMMLRIFPVLWAVLPRVIWIGVAAVIGTRLTAYAVAAVKYHRFASLHTYVNKATGAAVFAIPYLIRTPAGTPFCWLLFVISAVGTLEELTIHLVSRDYDARRKSILTIKRLESAP